MPRKSPAKKASPSRKSPAKGKKNFISQLPNKRLTFITGAVVSLLIVGVVLVFSSVANAVTINTVRPADVRPIADVATGPAGWYTETSGIGSVTLNEVNPVNAAGSAEFYVADTTSFAELGLYKHLSAAKLSTITALSYATNQIYDNNSAVSLQIGIDLDVTDSNTTAQGRLVYEPAHNTDFYGNPVTDDIWQTWQTLDSEAQWWFTWPSTLNSANGTNPCPRINPCAISDVISLYPNIGFNAGSKNPLILKAGDGLNGFVGYADLPSINDAIWDFEPASADPITPASKDECKDGGWEIFNLFKNQGDCISSIISNANQ